MLAAGESHGHRVQTGADRIDPPHEHLLDRDVLSYQGNDVGRRLADVGMLARLLPDA